MSTPKVLGRIALAATTAASVYTPAASKSATANLRLTNTSGSDKSVRVSISTDGTMQAAGFIVYDEVIPANGTLEVTGLAINDGFSINAYASASGVSAVAYGIEVG